MSPLDDLKEPDNNGGQMAARASLPGASHSTGPGGGIGGGGAFLLQFSSPFATITALAVAACLLIMLVFVTIFAVLQVIKSIFEWRRILRSHTFCLACCFTH